MHKSKQGNLCMLHIAETKFKRTGLPGELGKLPAPATSGPEVHAGRRRHVKLSNFPQRPPVPPSLPPSGRGRPPTLGDPAVRALLRGCRARPPFPRPGWGCGRRWRGAVEDSNGQDRPPRREPPRGAREPARTFYRWDPREYGGAPPPRDLQVKTRDGKEFTLRARGGGEPSRDGQAPPPRETCEFEHESQDVAVAFRGNRFVRIRIGVS